MAYRSSSSNSGNGSTPSVGVPAGVQAGDIVIVVVTFDANDYVADASDWPTGFTGLQQRNITADGQTSACAFKRTTGADSGTYTFGNFDPANGNPPTDWLCQAYAFSGRHASNDPVSTQNGSNTLASGPVTISATGVTAIDGDDLLFLSAPDVNASGIGNGHTPPSGYTERLDDENAWVNLSGATKENVSAGATGTVSGTFALTSGTAGYGAFLIRIPAAAVAAVSPLLTVMNQPVNVLLRM